MRFMYEGQEWEILFNRDHKLVEVIDREKNTKTETLSTFPTTKVMLLKVDPNKKARFWEVPYQAEASCFKGDKFTVEAGRIWALKKLTPLLPADMRPVVWDAYLNRPKSGDLREQNKMLRKLAHTALKQAQEAQDRYKGLLESQAKLVQEGMDI